MTKTQTARTTTYDAKQARRSVALRDRLRQFGKHNAAIIKKRKHNTTTQQSDIFAMMRLTRIFRIRFRSRQDAKRKRDAAADDDSESLAASGLGNNPRHRVTTSVSHCCFDNGSNLTNGNDDDRRIRR